MGRGDQRIGHSLDSGDLSQGIPSTPAVRHSEGSASELATSEKRKHLGSASSGFQQFLARSWAPHNEETRLGPKFGFAWDEPESEMGPQRSNRSARSVISSKRSSKEGVFRTALQELIQINDEEHRAEEEKIQNDLNKIHTREHGARAFRSTMRSSTMMMVDGHFERPDQIFTLRARGHRLLNWVWFDFCIGMVILANAATIGAEAVAKTRDEDPSIWIRILDYFFLFLYTLELGLRTYVYRKLAFVNHWVKFDAFLVVTGYFDLVVAQIADQKGGGGAIDQIMLVRMLRLCRLARMVRFFTQFRVLWALVQGLMHSFTTLVWTFVLMFCLLYTFAILSIDVFPKTTGETEEYREAAAKFNRGLGTAMLTLSQFLWFDSSGRIYRPLMIGKPATVLFFAVFILVCSIALMNLVITVMVERHMEQSAEDKDALRSRERERRKRMLPKLQQLFDELDSDGSGYIDLTEIQEAPQETKDHLQEIGQGLDIEELFKMLDYDGGGKLDSREFCEGLIKASTQDKPLELLRLVSMSAEMMESAREIADTLRWGDKERGRAERGRMKLYPGSSGISRSVSRSQSSAMRPFKRIPTSGGQSSLDLGTMHTVSNKLVVLEMRVNGMGSRVDTIEQHLAEISIALRSSKGSRVSWESRAHSVLMDEEHRDSSMPSDAEESVT